MVFDIDKDNYRLDNDGLESETNDLNKSQGFVQETILELVENDEGQIVLREANGNEDPLVTIDFSTKVHDMLGGDAQFIGHQMVHAAIQAVMKKQISQWHANVYDEEPNYYS